MFLCWVIVLALLAVTLLWPLTSFGGFTWKWTEEQPTFVWLGTLTAPGVNTLAVVDDVLKMRFKMPRPFVCSGPPSRGTELLMRVRMGSLCRHERTSQYEGRRADRNTVCPCCGAEVDSLSHLMFDCSATSAQRDTMFDAIKSVSGFAQRNCALLCLCLIQKSSCCVSCLIMFGEVRIVSLFSDILLSIPVQPACKAWDVRDTCKHFGAVLPCPCAPVRHRVDGIDAMA
jgi:hypothetical protein